jgi:hypothetical protein
MGQIFLACAYDIENNTCSIEYADKFHANCYSYSAAVFSIHYLLRQKPWRVMWGGEVEASNLVNYNTEDLLGLSTYMDFEDDGLDCEEEGYDEKTISLMEFINSNSKRWKKIDVTDDSYKHFNWEKNKSVPYTGYLLNHTKNLAVDLSDYFNRSQYEAPDGLPVCIDAVPVLTETGGGTEMAFLAGVAVESTEWQKRSWCGDLLQISEELPSGFKLMECCFSDHQSKARYCYTCFGFDSDGFLLADNNGRRYKCASLNIFFGNRVDTYFIKVDVDVSTRKIKFTPVPEIPKTD